ncbi:MAG: WD40 repeat domain-containing protein, partial [Planctomycetia bacterium]
MKNILAVLCVVCLLEPVVAAPTFERESAPILRAYCAGCHAGREAESGFSVERYATLRAGGSEAGDPVVPGDARASGLFRRSGCREAVHMPPADEPQPTAADLATLEAWVNAGAAGPAADVSILETLVVPTVAAFAGPQPVTAATVSSDGGRIAVARGRSLEILAVENGLPAARALVTCPDPPAKVAALHLSPDGSRLVVAGGIPGLRGVAEIREAATGKLMASFGGHRDMLYDAELSPDGTTLATAGYDRSIKLWRVADGSLERSIDVHNGAVLDVAWHPSGKVLGSASADETVKLWRAADGLRLDTFSQPQGEVSSLVFTPDGRYVIAAGRDRRIHLWKLASLEAPTVNPEVQARFAHEAAIVAIALTPDGRRLVTTAEDRSLESWTVPDLLPADELPRQLDVVSALAAVPGRLLV